MPALRFAEAGPVIWAGIIIGIVIGWVACWKYLPWALARAEVEKAAERMRKLARRK